MSSARGWSNIVVWTLLGLYLAILLTLTFLPGTQDTTSDIRVNTRPFESINRAFRLGPDSFSYRTLIGNVLAFVPFGLLVPLARPHMSWLWVLLAGAGLSVAIELGQLAVSLAVGYGYRAADVDDVIVNTAGVIVGYAPVWLGRLTQSARAG